MCSFSSPANDRLKFVKCAGFGNKASAIDFDNSNAPTVVKASSNVMRQNGGWRGKGAWDGDIEKTTVVLTGVPKILGAEILLSLLDRIFFGCYDYVYLPMDMEKMDNLGIAYDNFHKHSMAVGCQRYFSGFSLTAWPGGNFSERNCRAEWSSIQGYEANIQRQKLNDWMNSKIPEVYKPMVFDEDGLRLPMIFFCRNLRQLIGHGRVPKLVNLAAMNMVRSGGWRNWYGWNGRQDGWSNGHFFCVKAISGWKRPQMAMPTALKDFQFRNAEKPDLGVREWKVMGIPLRRTELSTPRCLGFCRAIQIRKRVKL